MSTQLTLPKGFGAVSSVFANQANANDDLGQGVASSYGIVKYRGKVWSIAHNGVETPLMREDGDGPRGSIEVVIVKAAAAISKIFYKNGYQDGANAAPDCWSSDGVKPDAAAQGKQSSTCANCPMNAWGSRVTEAGKPGKACSDSRRVAVVPSNDIANEVMGGPMLLRIPAASLKDLKAYGELLNSYGYPYYATATRISFDPKEAYPKMVFSAIRPLSDAEAMQVKELRGERRVSAVLSEAAQEYKVPQEEAKVPASPFEQDAPPAQAVAAAPAPAPVQAAPKPVAKAAAPKPKAQPKAEPVEVVDDTTGEVTSEGNATGSFDELLDNLLG